MNTPFTNICSHNLVTNWLPMWGGASWILRKNITANRRNHCIVISSTTDFENPTMVIGNALECTQSLTSTSWEQLQSQVHTSGGDQIDDREQRDGIWCGVVWQSGSVKDDNPGLGRGHRS